MTFHVTSFDGLRWQAVDEVQSWIFIARTNLHVPSHLPTNFVPIFTNYLTFLGQFLQSILRIKWLKVHRIHFRKLFELTRRKPRVCCFAGACEQEVLPPRDGRAAGSAASTMTSFRAFTLLLIVLGLGKFRFLQSDINSTLYPNVSLVVGE